MITYRGEKFSGYNKPKRTPGGKKKSAVLAKKGSKVKLVRDVLGFTERQVLRAALVAHARANDVVPLPDLGYGPRYNVVGPMIGPAGYEMMVVTGWIISPGARGPRNVTMFPAPKQGR